ncbi:hypothetical protein ACHAXA_011756 [Cyclostephanos tholiformis]|uniref:Uncharacterized protein n=1 Tax=Cyclostephanos tholiformis TaxID=382380 RepID=A0ABD3RXK0_9STRA
MTVSSSNEEVINDDGNNRGSTTMTLPPEPKPNKITTIIFDVDDTLYDVSTSSCRSFVRSFVRPSVHPSHRYALHLCDVFAISIYLTTGFTSHRNTDGATSFMIDKLHFKSREEAQAIRDEYFMRYHSTAKGLTAAEIEGRLPPLPDGVTLPDGRSNLFDPDELDEYWSTRLDFRLLGGRDPDLIETFERMSRHPTWKLKIVAFSNGPRRYVLRVLEEIGLRDYFDDDRVYGVTDVLPYCKPDVGSFEYVLGCVGAKPDETVMVEDSMKNIRAAKALGMRTILVVGRGRMAAGGGGIIGGGRTVVRGDAEAGTDDVPDETDPSVDAAVEMASEVGNVLDMWLGP